MMSAQADLAQLVEQLSCKQQVRGSSPLVGSRFDQEVSQKGVASLVVASLSFRLSSPGQAGTGAAVGPSPLPARRRRRRLDDGAGRFLDAGSLETGTVTRGATGLVARDRPGVRPTG